MSWIDHPGAFFSRYSGDSMYPALHPGDFVKFIPCRSEEICVGDVVVFLSKPEKRRIVHRVISLMGGIWTRGDSNSRPDDAPVLPENVCGKAISLQKKNRVIPVHGGPMGYFRALPRWIYMDLKQYLFRILHPFYHALADLGIFKKLFSPWVKYQRCHPGGSGKEPRMLARFGGRIIAVYRPVANCSRIRRPFRLIVDEDKLKGEFSNKG